MIDETDELEYDNSNGESIRDKKRRAERGHDLPLTAVFYEGNKPPDIYECLVLALDNMGLITLVEYYDPKERNGVSKKIIYGKHLD